MPRNTEGRAVSDTSPSPAGRVEGERRRDAALALLAERRAAVVRAGQRALLLRLLDAGTATTDDVRAAVESRPALLRCRADPAGRRGHRRARRLHADEPPEAHARPVVVLALTDRAAAMAWLDANPEMPEREPAAPIHRDLFD
jgi:hypothetical protein